MNELVENCIKFVKDYFKNDFTGHDYFHTLRVFKLASSIAVEENANLELVELASLLHDVDDIKISPKTHINKDNARSFLKKNNVDIQIIDKICGIIGDISYKGTETKPSSLLEGRIVQDADRLDALGAIGIARAFAYGGSHNRTMHDPNEVPNLNMTEEEYHNHVSTTINHFYEKLFKLKDLMNTSTGKYMALKKDQYMKKFVARFLEEWNG